MKRLILAAFALNATTADADRISLLFGTQHFDGGSYEEFNPGAFYTWERQIDVTAGVYRNSYGNTSV